MPKEFELYEDLANAIVERAVDDYMIALLKLERDPNNKYAKLDAFRLERFFHSGWYGKLTELDPDRLIRGAHILARKKAAKRRISRIRKAANAQKKALFAAIAICDRKEWDITEEDRCRLKGHAVETMVKLEAIRAAQARADEIDAAAIRSVGLQTRE